MQTHPLVLFTLLAALVAPAPAQQNIKWLPDNVPSGAGNAFPWGSAGVRYQVIATSAQLGGKPALIQDLFVAGDPRRGAREIVYDDIEIRMGMTPLSTPTASWKANNPRPTRVYRGPMRIRFVPGKWRSIGLPRFFPYNPSGAAKNLCIGVIAWKVQGQSIGRNFYFPPSSGLLRRAFRYKWTQNQSQGPLVGSAGSKVGILLDNGSFAIAGTGCKSSKGTVLKIGGPAKGWPQLGKLWKVDLTGGTPATPAFLVIGGNLDRWGSIKLPLDMKAINAPGCFVWHDVLQTFGAAVTGSGTASFPLPIPNSSSIWGARVFGSWLNLDPKANGVGLTTSSYMTMILGT